MTKFLLSLIVVFICGCAGGYRLPVSEQAKYDQAKSSECSRAEQDIMLLEDEKDDVGEKVKEGVAMIAPPAVIKAILGGDYQDRGIVSIAGYRRDIDIKIEEIRKKCSYK